jgi:hypothetical protein
MDIVAYFFELGLPGKLKFWLWLIGRLRSMTQLCIKKYLDYKFTDGQQACMQ